MKSIHLLLVITLFGTPSFNHTMESYTSPAKTVHYYNIDINHLYFNFDGKNIDLKDLGITSKHIKDQLYDAINIRLLGQYTQELLSLDQSQRHNFARSKINEFYSIKPQCAVSKAILSQTLDSMTIDLYVNITHQKLSGTIKLTIHENRESNKAFIVDGFNIDDMSLEEWLTLDDFHELKPLNTSNS